MQYGEFHGDEHLIQQELSELQEECKLNQADDCDSPLTPINTTQNYEPKQLSSMLQKEIESILKSMEEIYSK